jgi:hypothetical protein
MPGTRAYASGRFALDLDGVACGFLKSVTGGAIAADVVVVPGPEPYPDKVLGPVRYEELELQLGLSLDRRVYDWIEESWTRNYSRRDGSIVTADPSLKAASEREFFHALLSEVTLPALDGASKDQVYLTVKIAPEYTRLKKGSGKTVKPETGRQKEWLQANFKLDIDGLDCTRVSKIDALTVKQTLVHDDVGEARRDVGGASKLEFPDLVVSLAQTGSETWTDWFDDFVVKGNCDATKERSGKLTYLSADRKTPLGEVDFFNLGIFRLESESQVEGAESVARLRAGLYCERMELKVP